MKGSVRGQLKLSAQKIACKTKDIWDKAAIYGV